MRRILLAMVLAAATAAEPVSAQSACAGVVPGDPGYRQFSVFFAVGSAALTGEARATIRRAASEIKAQFKTQVCLIGRASPTGAREMNERLAASRIRAVADALADQGVQRGIIGTLVQGAAFGMRRDRAENPEDRSVMIMFPR